MSVDTRIDAMLSEYERRCEAGQTVSASELCADAPELLEVVERRIAALAAGRRFFAADTAPASTEEPAPLPTFAVPGYEILRPVGEGGMGIVYLARQVTLNRLVAIKTLRPTGISLRALQQLRQEALQLASVSHPNIVQVFEVGESMGQTFFALEWMPGGSLSDRRKTGPFVPRAAAELVHTMTAALEATHRVGLLHCDLKPANVLLSDDGTPKVADFGLARRYDEEQRQTQTGIVRGTPSYMAPEQAAGQVRTFAPTVDVYALGGILYELLTGRPPFLAATVLETLRQVQTDEPVPPRQLNPAIPIDLETICLKCLEKSPMKRYPSAAALREDLKRYLDGWPVLARRISTLESAWRWARRHPSRAALLGVCCFGALAAILTGVWVNRRLDAELRRTRDARDVAQMALVNQAAERLDAELRELAAIPQIVASAIESGEQVPNPLLSRLVASDPRVFGLCIALEGERPFALLAQQMGVEVRLRRLDQESAADYHNRDWYRYGRDIGRGWTAPYQGSDPGRTLMVSRVVPIQKAGRFAGVVVLDLSITALRAMRDQLRDLIPDMEEASRVQTATGQVLLESVGFEQFQGAWQRQATIPTTGWQLIVGIPATERQEP